MSELAASFERSAFGRRFRFRENRTTPGRDTVAGMTTFIVMSYIIFVNPAILGFAGVQGLEGQGLPFDAVLTSTWRPASSIQETASSHAWSSSGVPPTRFAPTPFPMWKTSSSRRFRVALTILRKGAAA